MKYLKRLEKLEDVAQRREERNGTPFHKLVEEAQKLRRKRQMQLAELLDSMSPEEAEAYGKEQHRQRRAAATQIMERRGWL